MKCVLRLFEVRRGHRTITLTEDQILVGRDLERCTVKLDPLDLSASRIHFGIERKEDFYFLKDYSKTGTCVNGERVGKSGKRLYHADVIEAGNADITVLFSVETNTAEELFAEGKKSESLDPAFAIHCYSLAHKQSPSNIEYAANLLNLLEQEGKKDYLITGGDYFNPEEMIKLAGETRIAAPIARALVNIGEFSKAMELIEKAGGEESNEILRAIAKNIKHQTGERLLKTNTQETTEIPFFQRGSLRIYIEERADFADLRYIEKYYKYLQQQIDTIFGSSPKRDVTFHITVRDHLFAQSLPKQRIILGYYSVESKRVFIRPRRWMENRIAEQDFHKILMHEYVHFRVDDICNEMWLPKWYNEGLAQVLSIMTKPKDFATLKSDRHRCKHVSLFSDAMFSPISGDSDIAYLQSHAILFYLMQTFGNARLISVLTVMRKSGRDFRSSFEHTLGMSFEDLDSRWWSIC